MSDSDKEFDSVFKMVVFRSNGELRMPLKRACLILGVAYQTVSNKRALGTWDQGAMEILRDPITGRLFVSAWEVTRIICGCRGFGSESRTKSGAPTIIEKEKAQGLGIYVSELRMEKNNG